jgi:hypothetical protein
MFDEPALRLLWSRAGQLTIEEALEWLSQARDQNGLLLGHSFTSGELRGFALGDGILPVPTGVPAARNMRVVVRSDSTCLLYPRGRMLNSHMWNKFWKRFDHTGASGWSIGAIAVSLRNYITDTLKTTGGAVLPEDECIIVVWNGNEFLESRYRADRILG